MIIPDNANPFFAQLSRAVEETAFEAGLTLVLCNSSQDPKREVVYFSALQSKRIDGVLLITSGLDASQVHALVDSGIPLVVLDREIPNVYVDTVLVDNVSLGYAATKHLLQHGHRTIACLSGPSSLLNSVERVKGYKQALSESGIATDESLICCGDFTFEGGYSAAKKILAKDTRPSALVASNDLMAIGAIHAVREIGLSVPNDLAIVSIDDILLAKISVPPLTTVAQPIWEMGQTATRLLVDRIRGNASPTPRRIVLNGNLVVRESCGCRVASSATSSDIRATEVR